MNDPPQYCGMRSAVHFLKGEAGPTLKIFSKEVDYLKVPTSSNPGGGVAELLGLEVGQLVGVGFSKS
jgi:hypothetical protein